MNWYLLVYLTGLIFPTLNYFIDLNGNNFDAHFSENTLKKMRLKDDSILRKLIPFKEGSVKKNGVEVGYRYLLSPRVFAFLIQIIIAIIGLAMLVINFMIVEFMNNICFVIVGGLLLGIWVIYTLVINTLSQCMHL